MAQVRVRALASVLGLSAGTVAIVDLTPRIQLYLTTGRLELVPDTSEDAADAIYDDAVQNDPKFAAQVAARSEEPSTPGSEGGDGSQALPTGESEPSLGDPSLVVTKTRSRSRGSTGGGTGG